MKAKENIHVLSRAIIIDQGHILLCKTLDLEVAFYFLPGGHVEHGESDFRAEPLRKLIPKWLKAEPNHSFSSEMISA